MKINAIKHNFHSKNSKTSSRITFRRSSDLGCHLLGFHLLGSVHEAKQLMAQLAFFQFDKILGARFSLPSSNESHLRSVPTLKNKNRTQNKQDCSYQGEALYVPTAF